MHSHHKPSAFLSAGFDEAVALCHEARAYFARPYQRDCQALSGQERLMAGRAAMRLTVTVAQVLAWMMAYRAGEGSSPHRSLLPGFTGAGGIAGHRPSYLAGPEAAGAPGNALSQGGLPEKLEELVERGDSLYRRIQRLESADSRHN